MEKDILAIYQKEVSDSVEKTLSKIEKEKKERRYVSLSQYTGEKIREELKGVLQKIVGLEGMVAEEILLELPPSHISGDLSLVCFGLAKKTSMAPHELAEEITRVFSVHEGEFIQNARALGPFVNLELNKEQVFFQVLSDIDTLGERYGESGAHAGKVALIDYSGPNIGKMLGIGHLRSTIIGQVLSNLYWKTGYSVVRDNHLGDGGTQLGALAYACQEWELNNKKSYSLEEYKNLYVRFTMEAKQNPELKQHARNFFRRLEEGDPEMLVFWKKVWDESVRDFNSLYEILGVSFDTCIGEIYYTDSSKEVVEECLKKNICRVEEKTGAVVVDVFQDVPSFLLRKEDGSTLYLTRDAATIKFRMGVFDPQVMVYVVGQEQELHFRQLFELSRAMGYLPAKTDAKYVGFGMIMVDGKRMSTRGGTLIELQELLSKSIDTSKKIIRKKNPALSSEETDKIANIIGVGAIIYNDLRQSRNKNISFDWDRMLSFEEGSAVYLQYTCVRVRSILEKIEMLHPGESAVLAGDMEKICFETSTEFFIARHLMKFPEVIIYSQTNDSPHHLCAYLEELARLFNSFYNEVSIIKTEDKNMRMSRIILCRSTAQVLKNGLSLLNIRVPDKM